MMNNFHQTRLKVDTKKTFSAGSNFTYPPNIPRPPSPPPAPIFPPPKWGPFEFPYVSLFEVDIQFEVIHHPNRQILPALSWKLSYFKNFARKLFFCGAQTFEYFQRISSFRLTRNTKFLYLI